eukprot:1878407-Pleurochrysis_carterae.AAC.1
MAMLDDDDDEIAALPTNDKKEQVTIGTLLPNWASSETVSSNPSTLKGEKMRTRTKGADDAHVGGGTASLAELLSRSSGRPERLALCALLMMKTTTPQPLLRVMLRTLSRHANASAHAEGDSTGGKISGKQAGKKEPKQGKKAAKDANNDGDNDGDNDVDSESDLALLATECAAVLHLQRRVLAAKPPATMAKKAAAERDARAEILKMIQEAISRHAPSS